MYAAGRIQACGAREVVDAALENPDDRARAVAIHGASLTTACIAIVVDVSEAQAEKLRGEDVTRWDEIREKLLAALTDLDDIVAVNFVAADDEVRTAFREPRPLGPSARRQLTSFLKSQRPRGGCDLWGAMRTAFEQPGIDTVLVISYAERDAGELRHHTRFFEGVQRRAEISRAVVHTVWLSTGDTGKSEENAAWLMRRIADDTGDRARMRTFD